MTPKEAKDLIDRAFLIVRRHSNLTTETQSLFEQAHGCAIKAETERRRSVFSRGLGRYRSTVETTARYFVCKWFAYPATVLNVRDAAALRRDCLYASALRLAVNEKKVLTPGEVNVLDEVESVDYAEHLSNGSVSPSVSARAARLLGEG